MKKIVFSLLAVALLATTLSFTSINGGQVMRRQGSTYIVNTTTLCSQRGFRGTTPLEVYIKGNKVVKVVPLRNQESPQFFSKVTSGLVPKFAGKSLTAAQKVDGVSGATYSSRAVKANVAAAIAYYKKHK